MTPNTEYTSPHNSMMLLQARSVNPLAPEQWTARMGEVIHALPNINRYNGHTKFPYSVAQHSLLCLYVAKTVHHVEKPAELLHILLHDAAETYLQDIIRPIKQYSSSRLLQCEEVILNKLMMSLLANVAFEPHSEYAIFSKEFLDLVDTIDSRMAATEVRLLLGFHPNPIPDYPHYNLHIFEKHHQDIRKEFSDEFLSLYLSL